MSAFVHRFRIAAALPLAAMTFFAAPAVGAQRAAAPLMVTEKENNGEVSVPAGGTLVVRLESNLTTGFSWQIKQNDPKILKPLGQPRYERQENPRPGAGGHQVFRFLAAGPADTTANLQLQYSQPFDKKTPPAKTFALTVRLTAAPGTVTVTDQDNGKNVTVPHGGMLIVRLESNPSTGFSWSVRHNEGGFLKPI